MTTEREDNPVNPRLRATFLEIVDNQLRANDPPETKETFNRLLAQGISETDAKLYIAQAVCVETFDILKTQPTVQPPAVRGEPPAAP